MADLKPQTAEASEWVQDDGYNPSSVLPQTLPSSSDKEFWGSAHQVTADANQLTQAEIARIKALGIHEPRIQGKHFICVSCPYTHTLDLSTDVYTLDRTGHIVPIDKGV